MIPCELTSPEGQDELMSLLLCGAVHIQEVPLSLRVSSQRFYIAAFRCYRDRRDEEGYREISSLLRQDILTVSLLGGRTAMLENLYGAYCGGDFFELWEWYAGQS